MRRTPPTSPLVAAIVAFGAASLSAASARAADCTTLPNPVYVGGSSAVKPVLAKVAQVLAAQQPAVTVVYLSQGSCVGVNTVLNKTAVSGAAAFSVWDGAGTETKCDVAMPGVQLDVGVSDVYADTCVSLPNGLPAYLTENFGPVQAMTFVVPNTSKQTSISAEGAYFVFGFGKDSGLSPWTDANFIFQRGPGSGTQAMIATAIAVPAAKWFGALQASSGAMVTSINMAGMGMNAESVLGILAADSADANRQTMHELAYQHYGQNCAYLPDSAANKFEKRNVRDGHYAIWGPLHLFQRTDIDLPNQGNITKTVNYITGAVDPPGVDLIAFEASLHVVPQCAMRVKRTGEMSPMKPFTPSKPCGCYYEYNANTATSCMKCMQAAECPTGWSCPVYGGQGFCEAP